MPAVEGSVLRPRHRGLLLGRLPGVGFCDTSYARGSYFFGERSELETRFGLRPFSGLGAFSADRIVSRLFYRRR